jgi:hypothetical protein
MDVTTSFVLHDLILTLLAFYSAHITRPKLFTRIKFVVHFSERKLSFETHFLAILK